MTRSFLIITAFCLSIVASPAGAHSGFSDGTVLMLKNMVLERIQDDPKILKSAIHALIERQLHLESRELDPKVVRLLVDRVQAIVLGLPLPPAPSGTGVEIPKIIMFLTGSEVAALKKIKGLLESGDKREILKYYFRLDNSDDWKFWVEPSMDLEYSNVTLTVPVHYMVKAHHAYTAEFRINHPMDSWVMDPASTESADLLIDNPDAVVFKSFNDGVNSTECDRVLKRLRRGPNRKGPTT